MFKLVRMLSFCALSGCTVGDTTDSAEATATSTASEATQLAAPPYPYDLLPFLGNWQYREGSGFTVSCGGNVVLAMDLFHAGSDGEPGTFSFLPLQSGNGPITDGMIHELDGLGCQYNFTIAGAVASVGAGQSCDRFPDGNGGFITTTTVSVTKSLAWTTTGPRMTIAAESMLANGCTLDVAGTAIRLYGPHPL